MKAILEFTLPEEQGELEQAQQGAAFQALLQDLANALRNKAKHDAPAPRDWSEVRDWFWEMVNEHELGDHLL